MYTDTKKLLSDAKFFEGYSRFDDDLGRYETWDESVDRVMGMHSKFYKDKLTPELNDIIAEATKAYKEKRILGAQRALQFGGDQLLKHQLKLYNCLGSHVDRTEFFGEYFYGLLCGCGVGFSVQKHHIAKLPAIALRSKQPKTHVVADSIEGWAEALDVLMSSYFVGGGKHPEYEGRKVYFDLNSIRQKGAKISGGFKAPGPEPLRFALDKIEYLLQGVALQKSGQLRPIQVYDILMYTADAVLAGGVRRSATICLFSPEDDEMAMAKTGDWYTTNPQRARSNNSAMIVRKTITRELFKKLMSSIRQFGEPGFVFAESTEHGTNPCLSGDTWVILKDGPIQIKNIIKNYENIDDKTLDILVDGKFEKTTSKGFWKTGDKETFTVTLKNGMSIRSTDNHQFLTNDGWKELKDLVVGDTIKISDTHNARNTFVEIKSIESYGVEAVYDCTVPTTSAFDANGIHVHNCVEIGFFPQYEGITGYQGCVSYDTKLITKDGIAVIGQVAENKQEIKIWNGQKWSAVKPIKTGENRDLYRVTFSDGSYLDATENHKFLIKNRFEKEYREVTTSSLIDIIKTEKYKVSVPRSNIVSEGGGKTVEKAYDYGFILGDGTVRKRNTKFDSFASVYKTNYKYNFPVTGKWSGDLIKMYKGQESIYKNVYYGYNALDNEFAYRLKYDVGLPDELFSWDTNSLLNFFAGWIDTDGTITHSKTVRIYGEEAKIRDGQLLLSKMGIDSSVNIMGKKGEVTNMGTRNRDVWYLQIMPSNGLWCSKENLPKKEYVAKGKNQVVKSITILDGKHDSYCFEESELHQGVFNNVLTKQCNLSEINGGMCTDEESFYLACRTASIMGTLQAGYTDFKFLSAVSRKIFEREALIGVSITGWMNNPNILFDEKILRKGAEIVKSVNKEVAKLLGINPAARTTCVKPSGNASVLLMTASGIHPEHSPRYLRNVQMNKESEVAQLIKERNPNMVEESVWSANKTDYSIAFPHISLKGSLFKHELMGVDHLEKVKFAQKNWVEVGTDESLCVDPTVRHNVSNTITVDDWDAVEEYVFKNRNSFAGISFLSMSGDKDYAQAPFTKVMDAKEIIKTYGTGGVFASGLVVEGLKAFNNNLWLALSTSNGMGEDITQDNNENLLKRDWVRRFKKFTFNYFDDNAKDAEFCLKDVYILHKWEKIQQNLVDIDWVSELTEKKFIDVDTLGSAACVGSEEGCLI